MKKLVVLFTLLSFPALAQQQANPVQDTVAKALGDFYIQVVTLQTQINRLQQDLGNKQKELDKCHKDGCKEESKEKEKTK